VYDNYKDYDGFVVIHGTDTMAYTASVLSFMLENLNKSVVLTGSQIPISELRNDAVDNFLGALLVAGPYLIPEVCLFFGNKLFRGNRATKEDSMIIEAFNSPNMAPLAKFGVDFNVQWDKILPHNTSELHLSSKLETAISLVTVEPSLNFRAIELIMKNSKAVVLAGYGAGNLPTNNKEFMRLVEGAIRSDVVVVIKTQCHRGSVDDVYETGRLMTEMGCILAYDMTIECIFAKLSYLFGKVSSTHNIVVFRATQ
jgi:60kDa lysophospholipase